MVELPVRIGVRIGAHHMVRIGCAHRLCASIVLIGTHRDTLDHLMCLPCYASLAGMSFTSTC